MNLVRVKPKFQVTIPLAVRERAGIAVGDLLEASLRPDGSVSLVVKSVVDRRGR